MVEKKLSDPKKLKIGIVGSGNVGSGLAVALSASGYDVELVARRIKGVKIGNKTSISIMGDFGSKSFLVPVVKSVEDFTSKKDIVFICTKSYDAIKVMPNVNDSLASNGAIVTIQNTFWIDELKNTTSGKNAVCMYLDISFNTKDAVTYILDSGGITLGIYDRDAFDKMEKVKSVLDNITHVKETKDLYGFLIGRNILNTAISSLGAISGMKLGDILNDRNGRYLFVKIITESVHLFNSLGIKILPYNDSLDYYYFIGKGFRNWLYRYRMMKILRMNNKNIRSSALVELERGRKTEISVPMTNLVNVAKVKGVNVEYISAIKDMIVEIENGKRRVDKNAFYDKKLVNIEEK